MRSQRFYSLISCNFVKSGKLSISLSLLVAVMWKAKCTPLKYQVGPGVLEEGCSDTASWISMLIKMILSDSSAVYS